MEFISVDDKKKIVTVKVNAKVFPIDIIYSAAYSVLDRAYVILDGDPGEQVVALLRPRTFKGKLEELGRVFYDELINFAFYAVQSLRNNDIKTALVNAATGAQEDTFEDIVEIWEDKFGVNDERVPEEGK